MELGGVKLTILSLSGDMYKDLFGSPLSKHVMLGYWDIGGRIGKGK
jgi:hypothetical protein